MCINPINLTVSIQFRISEILTLKYGAIRESIEDGVLVFTFNLGLRKTCDSLDEGA